jgi:hypothetical protein
MIPKELSERVVKDSEPRSCQMRCLEWNQTLFLVKVYLEILKEFQEARQGEG